MGETVRIYIASKTCHAKRWRDLRDSGVPIISTWIDEAGVGETSDYSDLWARCIDEAKTATALVIYREDNELLKGGLVEVGAALGAGVKVFAIGFGTEHSWQNHPLVTRCLSLGGALVRIEGGQ